MNYQLVDQFGQPVHRQELTKLQAEPGITGVRSAFAQSVASGITPVQLARILMSAAEGDLDAYLVLAEEMEEKDPHYASVLGGSKTGSFRCHTNCRARFRRCKRHQDCRCRARQHCRT